MHWLRDGTVTITNTLSSLMNIWTSFGFPVYVLKIPIILLLITQSINNMLNE